MIPQKRIQSFKKAIQESKNPLFFFDGDADGTSSFLIWYRFIKEGHGVFVGRGVSLDKLIKDKIAYYNPDLVILLDIYGISQETIDTVPVPIYMFDHHEPIERRKLNYLNPRIFDDADNRPTSFWMYEMIQQDLWLATAGSVADWFLPPYIEQFQEKYPELLPKMPKTVEEALYHTPLGTLVQIINFCLKGTTKDAMKHVKILSRIKEPQELLFQTSPAGKYIYKKYQKVKEEYDRIKKSMKSTRGLLKLFMYSDYQYSLSSELSNEMSVKYPDKLVIVARKNVNNYACSLRGSQFDVAGILSKALVGVQGNGGGHMHACGASIAEEDFSQFIKNIKRELREFSAKSQ